MRPLIRLLWFIVALVSTVTVLVGICVFGYHMANAVGNVYVIATEGMQVRAANILMPNDEDTGDMALYFSELWIASDEELVNNAYTQDTISSFDYKLKLESIWPKPWKGTATVTLTESIPTITGTHPTGDLDAMGVSITEPCAAWQKKRYKLTLRKNDNHWQIDQLEIVDLLEPDPTPTKEPVITPTPTGTPVN